MVVNSASYVIISQGSFWDKLFTIASFPSDPFFFLLSRGLGMRRSEVGFAYLPIRELGSLIFERNRE